MRRLAVVVAMVCVGAVLSGCGGSDDIEQSASPKTAADLLTALQDHAYKGELEQVLALLSEDALNQRGKQWIDFIGRVGETKSVAAIRSLKLAERRTWEGRQTREFMTAFQEKSPRGFGKIFSVYIEFAYEENGRVLVWTTSSSSNPVFMAMERQDDESLKLLGEAELNKVYRALFSKLQKAYRQRGQKEPRVALRSVT